MSGILVDDGVSTPTTPPFTKRRKILVVGGFLILLGVTFLVVGNLLSAPSPQTDQAYAITVNISLIAPDDAHGQRLLEIRHTGGDIIASVDELRFTLAPPDGDSMFATTPIPVERDGQVTFAKPGDTVYVYLRTDGHVIMSNAIPAYSTFMDFPNGRWRLQIDDNWVNAKIVAHTFLIADSMTYPVPSGYSLRSGIKKVAEYGTVFVYGNLYKERLEIDRPMRLISTSRAVLDGGNLEAIVQVKANSVMIDGFEIKNSGNSEFISGGIVVHENAIGTVIRNNVIHHCSNAIWLWGADSAIIQNNTLYKNDKAGILMDGEAYNHYVKYNTAYENLYGILVTGGNYNTINENVFHDNDKYAIYIENYKALQNVCEYNDFGNDQYECVDMAVRQLTDN